MSVTVALAGAGVVAAAAWSVQTVGLPPPSRAGRVAAVATRWLTDHRAVVDIFHADGERLKGICVDGWFTLPNGKQEAGSLLALQSGAQYLVLSGKVRSAYRFRRRATLPRLAIAVGCRRSLARALLPAEQGLFHLHAERAYAAGQPAIALHLRPTLHRRFSLYVSAATYKPLVAIIHAHGWTVTARIYLTRATHALLRSFDVSQPGARYRQ